MNLNSSNDQHNFWLGSFGDEYIQRTGSLEKLNSIYFNLTGTSLSKIFENFFSDFDKDMTILELGCNVGIKLEILKNMGFSNLTGLEMNPKALDICSETLSKVDKNLQKNIIEKGIGFKKMLFKLQSKYPYIITEITGTGLLISANINKSIPVWGENSLETTLRLNGLNVIHGGDNALRFTPHFKITHKEINLIYQIMNKVFKTI